jgi:hypothetical protein
LCTAIVCPIISGTIVERRDQVFTTFFSFRVFSPSTFSRRWPSTNGPFFSERAIDSLFLHSAQAAPWRAPHLLESSYRPRNAMRLRAKRAHKPRALRVRNPLHNHRPARLAQLVQHRLRRRYYDFPSWPHRLGTLRRCALCACLSGPRRALCCRSPQRSPPPCCSCPRRSCCSHRVCSHWAALPSPPSFQRLLRHACTFASVTSFSQRCCGPYACCCASSCPTSGKPKAFAGDCPSLCLHRRRAGDPRGS